MNQDWVVEARERMKKAVAHCRDDLYHIRTGKATPVLLDPIKVDYYGSLVPLRQIATITAPEPRLLIVQPYERQMISAIEKAILASGLGLNPQNDGRVVRIPIPPLTAERREELIKVIRRIAEEGRIAVRNIRRDINEIIKKMEKEKTISEDESKRLIDQVQKETDHFIEEIDKLLKTREDEIRNE